MPNNDRIECVQHQPILERVQSEPMQASEYHTMRAVEDTYWWYVGLRTLVVRQAQHMLHKECSARVLDAGCGTGGAMEVLHQAVAHSTLVGVDVSPTAVVFTTQRNVGAVAQASVESLPFAGEVFDLVISLDVLYMKEVDDRRALGEFSRVLKPGGSLLVNLPACEFLQGQHDMAMHTGRRYTKSKVRTLLSEVGFAVELLTYWNTTLFPVLALWRPLSRVWANAQQPRSDLKRLPGLVNRILTWLILGEIAIAPYMPWPFGSSVFGVARKVSMDRMKPVVRKS